MNAVRMNREFTPAGYRSGRTNAIVLLAICIILPACKSVEGTYAPACMAYEGDTVELRDGQFEWEKFTDMVAVGEDGKIENQFPGYPKSGTYRIDGQTVRMESASGEQMETMYLLRDSDRQMLLTQSQFAEWESTGRFPDCALTVQVETDAGADM